MISPPPNKRSTNWEIQSLPAAVLPVSYFDTHSAAASGEALDESEPGCYPRVNFFWLRCYGCEPQNDPVFDSAGPCTTIRDGAVSPTFSSDVRELLTAMPHGDIG